jgi:UDP-N-acetylglucosamine 2-epimerase (non-hydrolysing)
MQTGHLEGSLGSVLLCMGTRPEIIKMAPVYQALRLAGINARVLHTGQHEEMAWPLYSFFDIKPDHVISLDRIKPTLGSLAAELMSKISEFLEHIKPELVLVHGDTLSAAVAAQAAFFLQIPIGHVEAGLRSSARYDPFPEELNRQMIARFADIHFAPTELAFENLKKEGIDTSSIVVTERYQKGRPS